MTKASRQLTSNDENVLHSTIGKTISGLRIIHKHNVSSPIGLAIIDFEDESSVEIHNDEKPVLFFDDKTKEEIVGFSCKEYKDALEEKIDLDKYELQHSTIENIEVITDKVTVESSKFEDYEIVFDSGIIFHGSDHDYVFALDKTFFFEIILYSTDGKIDEMRPIEGVHEVWSNGEHIKNVKVERLSRLLK